MISWQEALVAILAGKKFCHMCGRYVDQIQIWSTNPAMRARMENLPEGDINYCAWADYPTCIGRRRSTSKGWHRLYSEPTP